MKNILPILVLGMLGGCSTLHVATPVPKETDVIVTVAPAGATHTIVAQMLPVDLLTTNDKGHYDVIADAYEQSLVIVQGEFSACMIELNGYQHFVPPKP